MLAVIIQYLNDKGINYSPSAVSDDILEAIEWVHMSGKMHNIVSNNLERFLSKDPNLRVLLPRFRAEGKELFLLTNSSFDYVNAGLTYLLGDQWRDVSGAQGGRGGRVGINRVGLALAAGCSRG